MLILNEEKYAQSIYECTNNDVKSIVRKIGYITRYLLYTLHKSDEDNYKESVNWLRQHHNNFDESYYSHLISDAIKKAHKQPFYHIDNICITQSELDIISSLDNLRAEKILFVLLCMAKQQSVAYGFTGGLVKYSITDICKMARISVPSEEREYILYDIIQHGLLDYPKKNDTKCLIVKFANEDDEAVLKLNEIDCEELAYVYLNWKNNGKGYGRCEYCNKLMKKPSKNPNRFCEDCSKVIGDIADNQKVVKCIDCGKVVCVSIFDSASCRCEECQVNHRKEAYHKYNAKRRNQGVYLTTDPIKTQTRQND